ncbi:hypothetical protein [Streptomyces sp. NPDC088246]|uniref:hypothetical protein n=1 Tax=Streptomyces sp. NPDC088246 TaxID=3365842 RepID=UPI0038251081
MTSDYEAAERPARGIPLGAALGTSSAAAWVALDLDVRHLSRRAPGLPPWRGGADGRRLRRDRDCPLPAARRSPTLSHESRLAFALCHPDGRIREAALEQVPGMSALLPLLIVRCADWVRPVRDRARTLLSAVPGRELIPLAELVLLVARRTQGAFALEVLDRAVREAPPADIETLLACKDRATRRFAHRIAVDRGLLSPARLARVAAASDDPALQNLCAEAAIAGMREEARDEVLGPLLTARAPRVRSAGVTALRRAGLHGEARAFLADRSGVVRACARYVLRQDGVDPLPLYRSMCADLRRSMDDGPGPLIAPAAPAGLGECGSRTDAETLWSLLAHPLPAVRVHSVVGLRALDAVDRKRLTPLLDDPSSAVVRAATRALLPDAAGFPEEWLRIRTAQDRPRAVRVAARRLLRAAGLHRRSTC